MKGKKGQVWFPERVLLMTVVGTDQDKGRQGGFPIVEEDKSKREDK